MSWFFPHRLTSVFLFFLTVFSNCLRLSLIFSFSLVFSCGKVYFPIELKTTSRSDRAQKQQENLVQIIPMNTKSIKVANSFPYKRYIVDAGNLQQPAKFVPASRALVEKLPTINDPGPYLIGKGDILVFELLSESNNSSNAVTGRRLVVSDVGLINFFQLGRIEAVGKTLSQLEDLIFSKVVEAGGNTNFNLNILDFRSKKIYVSTDEATLFNENGNSRNSLVLPYNSTPIFLRHLFAKVSVPNGLDAKITIFRGTETYVVSYRNQLKRNDFDIRLFPNDKIDIQLLNYRAEKVLIVGETGAQKSINIEPIQRPSLSHTIFSGSVLNSITSDFSQIYVLRKNKKMFNAYHLDITDPTRVDLANKFEMRPDDIVFVATQPLSLYSRTLSQILGSAGLTLQARDTIRTEIGN